MRVLVTVIPGLGHWHPMVPLCRALVESGHDVRVAVSDSFIPTVRATGLDPVVVRPDWLEERAEQLFPDFHSGVPAQMGAFTALPTLGLVDDLLEVIEQWSPDVVLHDHLEFGGWVAAELADLPNVPFAMTARGLEPAMIPLLTGDGVTLLLEHFGLPADPECTRPTRWLYLDSIPASFAGSFLPPGPAVHAVRYASHDRSGQDSAPAWLSRLGARPVVYVTLGTVFNRTPGFLRTLVDGASAGDVDVVVTTGRTFDPAELGSLPGNVRAERYVALSDLLPHVDAVVCHAGFNTVFGALQQGKPIVVVPLSADQPLNAFLVEQAGLGLSLTTETPEGSLFPLARPAAISAEQVAQAVDTILTEPSYAARARQLAAEMDAAPSLQHAVSLIEQLVLTGEPVLGPG